VSSCPVCGKDAAPAPELVPLPFARCASCGLVFRSDVDAAEVHGVYEAGDYEDVRGAQYGAGELAARRRDARVRLRWIAGYAAAGGRLLDVGAAGGAFVVEALASGYAARGVEPTPAFARHARDVLGVDVEQGTLEAARLEPATLDVVTMWHVLEHVPSPLEQLERLREALVRGGVLAVEVPNYGSAVAARMGTSWPSLEPAVHVNQFTPASLGSLFERAGFEPVRLESVPITPYLSRAARLGARHMAARMKAAVWLRSPRTVHPHGHELLRAVARRPLAR
jgi:SAM-dependent methyltransferase